MGKKRKHKIKNLRDEDPLFTKNPIELEENAEELFKEHLKRTNWDQVAQAASKREEEERIQTRKSPKRELKKTLDLHGYTLKEAKNALDELILSHLSSKAQKLTLKIITGKGLRSGPEGAILPKEIPLHLKRKWAKRILFTEESPASMTLNGVPIRGDFTIILDITP